IDEAFTKQHPGLKPGDYVCLTIEDDGEGMDEETKDGIFEPFFTTKFQGRGMGMAAVYGIIKGHDGTITVESEPGKGTVVRIYLPAISVESRQEAKAVKQPEAEIAMGEGTILIIEDEETLVDLFREILERLGYRALLARTGKEAVELAKTFDGQIDLALLDIKLPDMDGGKVYPLIMEARPDMKVLVCSGYSIHGPARAILDAGAEGFIQKPFFIAPFAEKLKEVLDAG
ncbi:MAG: response regulator, partial [Deltaproteobacteria bacterium]|nr:response regulator [Deltaproteobacteria bacterium]